MITVKHSELASNAQGIQVGLAKLGELANVDNKLKSNIAKIVKEFRKASTAMGDNFKAQVLEVFQDGVNEHGQPNIPEGKQDEFKAAQIAFGEKEITLECNKLSSELLLGIDKISANDIVNLAFFTDFQ